MVAECTILPQYNEQRREQTLTLFPSDLRLFLLSSFICTREAGKRGYLVIVPRRPLSLVPLHALFRFSPLPPVVQLT